MSPLLKQFETTRWAKKILNTIEKKVPNEIRADVARLVAEELATKKPATVTTEATDIPS